MGVFTPGKSFSSLSLVRTKIQCIFFGLVRFLFTLQFSQESQDLTTNPHVCKDRANHWTKRSGAGQHGKLRKSNNHGSPACCIRCAHVCLFVCFSHKHKRLRVIWSIRSFWCNVDFMRRCLPFGDNEDVWQEASPHCSTLNHDSCSPDGPTTCY